MKGLPFLVSQNVLTCFKFSILDNSVRAQEDLNLQRIIFITRLHPDEYSTEILSEFKTLVSTSFTFVDDWNDPIITPDIFRIFSKKLPARHAVEAYISQVKAQLSYNEYIEIKSVDTQKPRSSLSEWSPANESTSNSLDKILKEPSSLLFFVGAIVEFTCNVNNKYSQSQLGLILQLPSQDDVDSFKNIQVMVAPPEIKEFVFNGELNHQYYTDLGWKYENVGLSNQYEVYVNSGMKGQRKQYCLKHHVTSTVHSCQGDTLHKIVTEIKCSDKNYQIWEKGQVVVLVSRTKRAEDIIFVGNKSETIKCLTTAIQTKSQWMDYQAKLMALVDVRNDAHIVNTLPIFNYDSFPFEIRSVRLPDCNTEFVYFMVSIKNRRKTYIGESLNIQDRFNTHQRGAGTIFTGETMNRPWAILAYICGFDGRKLWMKSVEDNWQRLRLSAINRGVCDPRELARTALHITNNSNNELRFIQHFE